MIRKTLTIFSLIGLLLSVGAWGASYWNVGYFNHPVTIFAFEGCVGLRIWHEDDYDLATVKSELNSSNIKSTSIGNNFFLLRGFQSRHTYSWWGEIVKSPRETSVVFALWIPTLIFALLPAYALLPHHRRRKRRKLGLCLKCGYDLRGSEERCPECGRTL